VGQAGDGIDDHGLPSPTAQVAGLAGHLKDLRGVREAQPAHRDRLQGADLHPAVGAVAGAVQHRHLLPGQPGASVQQGGLVGLDGEQVVRGLGGDQELCGLSMGVECISRDHRPGQVQVGQQRLEAGHLAGGAVDGALGQHPTGGVLHGGQQVNGAAVTPGAPKGLAVHRDRPSTPALVGAVAVGQPRADHLGQGLGVQAGQRAADGGLGGHDSVCGRITAGAKRHPDQLRDIRSPLGDRGHRSCAGQHRCSGYGQDRDQRVASATATSRVADRGEVGQQVRRFGLLQGGWRG
jgi:hypothetical protein